MNELGIWTLKTDGTVEAVKAVSRMDLEERLEDALVRRPDMLEPGIHLVGRQTPTGGGILDLLGVDKNGHLVVFELKRNRVTRDVVAQCLDYASALDEMAPEALGNHIEQQSGRDGIKKIDDFEKWYEERFDEDQLLPPRLVLVGIGVDEPAERMARFLQAREVDISVLTFYSFQHGNETLLARQVEFEAASENKSTPATSHRPHKSASEKQEALERRLHDNGTTELFDRIRQEINTALQGGSKIIGSYGVTFNLRGTRHKICRIRVENNSTPIHLDVPSTADDTDSLAKMEKSAEAFGWQPLNSGNDFGITIEDDEDWEAKRSNVNDFLKEAAELRRKAPATDAP